MKIKDIILTEAKASKSLRELAASKDTDWLVEFCRKFNSAVEAWGNKKEKEAVRKAVAEGKDIRVLSLDLDTPRAKKLNGAKEYVDAQKEKVTSKGYALVAEEYNMDSYEAIFVKGPALKESGTFTKVTWEQFERIASGSDDYSETEVDGKTVTAVYDGDNCVGLFYTRKQFGTHNPGFVGDALSYSECDPNWPWN